MRDNLKNYLLILSVLLLLAINPIYATTLYVSPANANVVISSDNSLNADLVCGSLTITSNAVLTTNGFNIYCNNTIDWHQGVIVTGQNPTSGDNGGGSRGGNGGYGIFIEAPNVIAGPISTNGENGGVIGNDGGSGGGGAGSILVATNNIYTFNSLQYYVVGGLGHVGGAGCPACSVFNLGDRGGNTLIAGGVESGGAGSTPNTITITNNVIQSMYSNGMITSLEGNGGGQGGNFGSMSSTIVDFPNSLGGSGGGGGDARCCSNSGTGGIGGNGLIMSYIYTQPPILVLYAFDQNSVKITPSNVVLDSKQYLTLSATWIGGNTPFVGNFFNVTANAILHSHIGINAFSDSYTFQVNSPTSNNAFSYNFLVTESTGGKANSITNTIIVNPILTTPTLSVSNTLGIDTGQYEVFNAFVSGGTTPYTYNFIIYNSVTHSILTSSASSSNSLVWQAPNSFAGNSIQVNVIVTDSASTPVSVNSVSSNVIGINGTLTSIRFIVSNAIIDAGQTQVLSAIISGGTPPYTFNFLVANGVGLVANQLSSSNSFSFVQSAVGTQNANVIITDSAPIIETATNSLGYTSHNALTTPSVSPSLPKSFDYGQSITFSTLENSGTPPYTFNFIIKGTSQLANSLGTPNSFVWSFPFADIGNTIQANIIITDSASTNSVISIKSGFIQLNQDLLIPNLTASALKLFVNKTVVFTATLIPTNTGTSSYTYNFSIYDALTNTLIASKNFSGVPSTLSNFAWKIPSSALGKRIFANVLVTDSASTPVSANSLQLLFAKSVTVTTTTSVTTTILPGSQPIAPVNSNNNGGILIAIVIIAVVVVWFRNNQKKKKEAEALAILSDELILP